MTRMKRIDTNTFVSNTGTLRWRSYNDDDDDDEEEEDDDDDDKQDRHQHFCLKHWHTQVKFLTDNRMRSIMLSGWIVRFLIRPFKNAKTMTLTKIKTKMMSIVL